MPPNPALSASRRPPRPLRVPLAFIGYFGGLGLTAASALRALVRPRPEAAPLIPSWARQLESMLRLGVPLVVLAHVPLGSFLAMQAYFGATFREAVGAVVGLGLLRNMAPMMTGLVLAGLFTARFVPQLRDRPRAGLDDDPSLVPDRDVLRGHAPDRRAPDDPGRLALVRLMTAITAGPILTLCGLCVGNLVGIAVTVSMLGMSADVYLATFCGMLEPIDVLGFVLKPILFGAVVALSACNEGLRDNPADPRAISLHAAVCRAACTAMVGILFTNSAWFTLAYTAGSPFGPVLAN